MGPQEWSRFAQAIPRLTPTATDRPVFRYIPTGISLEYQTNWFLHEAWTPRCLSSLAKNGRPPVCVCRSRFPPGHSACRLASWSATRWRVRTRMAVDELTINPKRRCLRLSRRLRSRSAASRQTAWGLVSRTISLDAGNLCRACWRGSSSSHAKLHHVLTSRRSCPRSRRHPPP